MTWGFGVEGVENLRFCIEKFNIDEYEELFRVYIILEMEVEFSEFSARHWTNLWVSYEGSGLSSEPAWFTADDVTQHWEDNRRTKANGKARDFIVSIN